MTASKSLNSCAHKYTKKEEGDLNDVLHKKHSLKLADNFAHDAISFQCNPPTMI